MPIKSTYNVIFGISYQWLSLLRYDCSADEITKKNALNFFLLTKLNFYPHTHVTFTYTFLYEYELNDVWVICQLEFSFEIGNLLEINYQVNQQVTGRMNLF